MSGKSVILRTAPAIMAVALVFLPLHASAQASPGWTDRYGSMLQYNPLRGDPGPGNGPIWQGEPTDGYSIWRHGRYRGNDPDNNIRDQIIRDR